MYCNYKRMKLNELIELQKRQKLNNSSPFTVSFLVEPIVLILAANA